jgi:small nuclear ribonucleoprotein (snRNP)-like protein
MNGKAMQRRQRRKTLLQQELESMLNSAVVVVLKNGKTLTGTLKAFDPMHLNIVLYSAKEQLGGFEAKYSKLVIRGDSIEYIGLASSE